MIPFWEHLGAVCDECGVERLMRDDFGENSLTAILADVKGQNPDVYERLEERRRHLWDECQFASGLTLLAMTHKAAELFHSTHVSRVWHHPDFDPNGDETQEKALKRQFCLKRGGLRRPRD